MRRKKLLSTVVASALVATQLAIPVAAAGDGGNFDVNVTTKTGVLRVQVPTSMAIAVDQFMIKIAGTQIASDAFEMTNLSEMDVKVTVTSTATLGAGISLVATAQAAENSNGDEAWLGVAAMTNDGSGNSNKYYDDLKTGDATTPKVEELGELTDENANVTSFVNDTKQAEQIFYLEKGAGTADYKLAVPDAADYEKATFAKHYELTAETAQPSNKDALQQLVDTKDIYYVVTADAGKHNTSVTKLEKGATVADSDFNASNTYYVASETASDPATGKIYVYGSMQNEGGKAGFTYIGKLSGKKETWTNADITKINVAYTIAGITADRYDEVKDACTYGLYMGDSDTSDAPDEVAGTKITNGGGSTEFNTKAKLATQLKSYSVVFRFDTTATDVSDLEVTKIVIDGEEYEFTAGNASSAANSDGKAYTLKNFTANTAEQVEVYYGNSDGDSYVIKYTITQ